MDFDYSEEYLRSIQNFVIAVLRKAISHLVDIYRMITKSVLYSA